VPKAVLPVAAAPAAALVEVRETDVLSRMIARRKMATDGLSIQALEPLIVWYSPVQFSRNRLRRPQATRCEAVLHVGT
jgi:hypothetical protein